jgi:hypothetical protein
MPHAVSGPRPRARQAAALAALALSASLLPGLAAGPTHADDPTCVGRAEYKKIRGGMSIQKLAELLDGQVPFADLEGTGTTRIRWYDACETWQSVKDVKVRYRDPLVGRRSVTGKRLAVYQTELPGPREPGDGGRGDGDRGDGDRGNGGRR